MTLDESDRQQHRHMARITAEGLFIFHDQCLRAGISERLADLLTVEQYKWLLAPDPQAQARELLDLIEQLRRGADDGES